LEEDVVSARFFAQQQSVRLSGFYCSAIGFKVGISTLAMLENVGQNSVQGLRDILHRTA
jgi:hypothetical protein